MKKIILMLFMVCVLAGSAIAFSCTEDVTFTYRGSSVTYGTVSSDGECWLDRNLGASRVATAYNDYLAYGDLFQWGRLDDGHQTMVWVSSSDSDGTEQNRETSTTSSGDVPGHSNFIIVGVSPYDWRNPPNNNLWQRVSGINNPCPSGWRIPTETEWNAERLSWTGGNNYVGAFGSSLKLTAAGSRKFSSGSLSSVGTIGNYWSSIVVGTTGSRFLYFKSDDAFMHGYSRGYGFSVRCLYDSFPPELNSCSPTSGITGTPIFTCTANENAWCRMSLTDETYADMSDNIDCTGDGTTSISCAVSPEQSVGTITYYMACSDAASAGNEDTIATNEHHSYQMNSTEPTYSNFTSTETTNFSEVTLASVTSLTLAIDNKGKIAFPLGHSINAEDEDYDTNIVIEDKVIFVNSFALHSSFNNSATLTFYNVDCNKPYVFYSETASTFALILSENQRCPDSLCSNIQCDGSTLTVDVVHFTGFAAGSNANLTTEAQAGVFYPLDPIEFTAEYINSTDGTPISGECNITFDDEGTWYTMDFNSPDYNYTKSFATAGLHEYNVTCSSANFVTLEANDTKLVSSVDIPEFSIITLGFGLIAVLCGLIVMRKRR